MKIKADMHVHISYGENGYEANLEEVCAKASEKELLMIAVTETGPASKYYKEKWSLERMKSLPKTLNGIYVMRGVESNIINFDGQLDLDDSTLLQLDFVIASLHEDCLAPGSYEENTNAWIKVTQNQVVDCLGHLGNPKYPCDYDNVIWMCKKKDKIIELNENSFTLREGSEDICREIAQLCIDYDLKVIVSSACHKPEDVGNFDKTIAMLKEMDFPEHLVLNADEKKLGRYLRQYKNIDIIG